VGTENLDKFFNPRRIAVIGASDREGSLGAKILRNLVGVGYGGAVYPVNPFKAVVQGITAYPNVAKIPWKVDLAVIATPAHTVPQIIEECGKAGISAAIIISAGFKESGLEGAILEEKIVESKNRYSMRIIGSSSFGVMRPRIKLNATFSSKAAEPAHIAFVSQSAALCASVLDWAAEAHTGFSAVVSTGTALDVDLGDLIDYFEADPHTRSIVLYVESIRHARKFMSAARGVARSKPIVVVKAGRSVESAEATACHIGALCGEDDVYDAAFRRVGVVRVDAITDLFNCAEALAMQPNPQGSNLTIITNAGGPAIIATDYLIAHGGRLSGLSDETRKGLESVLPAYCSITNPVDILEDASVDRLRKSLEICLKDAGGDGFLIIYTPQSVADPVSTAKTIVDVAKNTSKPILTSLMGEGLDCWKARQILRKNGIPAFTTPEQAVSTFMYMCSYTQNLELLYQTPEELSVEFSIPTFLKELLRKAYNEGRQILSLPESLRFLEAYNIPVIKTLVAKTAEEAEVIASNLGYPVVMKALSPQITHKSEAEGVILNVWSPPEVKTFFDELASKTRQFSSEAEFQGVVIQPMIRKKGHELLIGAKKDPQFGSVISFGTGGTVASWLKDVSVGFPPLNQILARRLIEKTAIYRCSKSKHHPLNLKLLEEILVKFSQFVIDFPEIKEIDLNPLIVSQDDAVAVDARIAIDSEGISKGFQPHEHLVIAPYPVKYVTTWQLKNGTPVVLRPIKPEDEALFQELFKSFSQETMRLRFFQIIKDISHDTLTRYCNLDYDREIAMVALLQDTNKIIGATRLILEPGKEYGEFAVVVGDPWQGQGLGSKLMDLIKEIGKDMGMQTIYGYVMADNSKMMNLCKKKGFTLEPGEEGVAKATFKLA
jgi:acetyltransferase